VEEEKAIFKRWRDTCVDISSEIDAIIQGQLPVSSKNRSTEDLNDNKQGDDGEKER
jgi:hypothetical protein